MLFFRNLGNLLCDHTLIVLLWLFLSNFALYALCGEDENRVAHKKSRFPAVIPLLLALLGGSIGGLMGVLTFRPKKKRRGWGVLYALLSAAYVIGLTLCLIYADRSLVDCGKSVVSDIQSLSHILAGAFKGAILPILVIFGIQSLIAFAVFGIDKHIAAKSKGRRVPEIWLMELTVLGGALGALAAMLLFHHKTRHVKFTVTVPLCLILQLLFVLCIWLG
ncbi:MAG: DUF1294 domain-containing protein [Eubacteriales bacterium]